jgi:hypothetical protein
VLLALAALLGGRPAFADLRPPPKPRGDPPMRIVHVTSSDPACEPNCPEWISAEGRVMPGTAAAFGRVIGGLGGRRLPVLISSHGGSLRDALLMGELVRQRGLAVAVARTIFANCPGRGAKCPPRGEAITGGAFCASACPLVLAGGVERFVGPVPMVGVHQITEVLKEEEGSEHLTTIKKIYEPASADLVVQSYLANMGVGDPVMTLLRKTPASSIRWLSLPEMSASHLATETLDAAAPVMTTGANGLNGHAFEGDPTRPNSISAKGAAPLHDRPDGPDRSIETTLTYRRGGGTVEIELAASGAAGAAPTDWTLMDGGDPVRLKASGARAEGVIARDRFCTLAHDGKMTATPGGSANDGTKAQTSLVIDLSVMEGVKALVAEACP